MKILNLLEAHSEILFHYTSKSGILGMIRSGKIRLSPLNGNPTEMETTERASSGSGHKFWFLSTARSRRNTYIENAYNPRASINAILVINGRRLSQYGKIVPVQYYAAGRRGGGETEDRLTSDHGEIPLNVVSYFDILISGNLTTAEKKFLMFMKKNFTVRFFEDRDDWYAGRNPIEFDEEVDPVKGEPMANIPRVEVISAMTKILNGGELDEAEKTAVLWYVQHINAMETNFMDFIRTVPETQRKQLLILVRNKFKSLGTHDYMNEIDKLMMGKAKEIEK